MPQHAAVFSLTGTNTIAPHIVVQCQPLVIPEQAHGFFIRRIFCKAHLMFHRKRPKRITAPARRLLFPCSFFAAPASTKIQVQRHIFKASVVCKVLIFDPVPDRMVKQMLYILHRDRAYRAKSGQSPIIRHCRLQHVTAALARCPKQYGTRRAAFQRGLQPDRGGNVRQEAPAGVLLPRHKILFYDLPNLLLRLDVYKAFLITHCVTSSPTNRFIPSDALFGTPRSGA